VREPIGVVGRRALELSDPDGGLEDRPALASGNSMVVKPSGSLAVRDPHASSPRRPACPTAC